MLPDFDADRLEKAGDIWTNSLNVPPRHWRAGFPGLTDRFEYFAIDYSGQFWVEQPGRSSFALVSDDGSRLYIDETPVIDDDCAHPPDLRLAAVQPGGGGHSIRISYFQGPRDCLALVLAVSGPDGRRRVFDTNDMKAPSNPEDWKFPERGSLALVPVKPAEARLSIDRLLEAIGDTAERTCLTSPARHCGP